MNQRKRKSTAQTNTVRSKKLAKVKSDSIVEHDVVPDASIRFVGDPVPTDEALLKWPHHYQVTHTETTSKENVSLARCHYTQAEVDGQLFSVNDDALVMAKAGVESYIYNIRSN